MTTVSTGPWHYREAERLIETVVTQARSTDPLVETPAIEVVLKLAHVHAMLAVAAAVAGLDAP